MSRMHVLGSPLLRGPGLRRLKLLLAAYLAFNLAEWATWIAILVWAYDEGGVGRASLVAFVQLVPGALLASPAANLSARLTRSRALLVGYLAQGVGFLTVAATLALRAPEFIVVGLATAAVICVSLTRPVHNALVPEISRTSSDLTAGNAASGALEAASTFLGPLLCAAVLPWLGAQGVFGVCGFLMLGAGWAAAALGRVGVPAPLLERTTPRRTRDILRDPAGRVLGMLVAAEYVLVGMLDILLVVLALDLLTMGQEGPGLLNSALGVGGVAGAASTLLLAGRPRMAPVLVVGGVCAGLPIACAGLVDVPWAAIVLIGLAGYGKVVFDVASRTLAQRLLPDRLLIGLFGVQESLMMTGLALGALLAPTLVSVLDARWAFAGAGAFLPVVASAAYVALRRLDSRCVVPVEVLKLLGRVPLLAVLAPRVLERLALDATAERAAAGSMVIQEGQPGEGFYVIATGTLDVSRQAEHLRSLGAGDWFGELALLHNVPRTASVAASSDVELWRIDREALLCSVGVSTDSVRIADTYASEHYR